MDDPRQARGRDAEDWASRYLSERGFRIVERNVRFKVGELDIVAMDGDTLCFVEVRSRQSARYGTALQAVSPRKQRQVVRAAKAYLIRHPPAGPVRFDVIGVTGDDIVLVKNAFRA